MWRLRLKAYLVEVALDILQLGFGFNQLHGNRESKKYSIFCQ